MFSGEYGIILIRLPRRVFFRHAESRRVARLIFFVDAGREQGGAPQSAKNMPVACFLGRGKIHILMNAPSMGVGMGILFVAVISNSIYSVQQTQKIKDILPDVLCFFVFEGGI